MIILAIETSCDDTCVSVVKVKSQKPEVKSFEILSNVVSSQVKLHAKYGGVYPSLAKREHQRSLPIVLKKALKEARYTKATKVDLIAVTMGPGLEPCLWTGVNFAKDLAEKSNLPIIPINHIEAHISANFLDYESGARNLYPAICLVVSGGHTQLILMRGFGKYRILGETRDDAAGECFDKVARILGLGYPGGPAIAKLARQWQPKITFARDRISNRFLPLPRPMIYQKNYDFSFSGLKTAVLYRVRNEKFKLKNERYVQEMSFETQRAVIDVLLHKTLKAAGNYKAKTIILGGGVAANDELRKHFKTACLKWKIKHLVPAKNLCTDNAAMVAAAAYYHWTGGEKYDLEKIEANANLRL